MHAATIHFIDNHKFTKSREVWSFVPRRRVGITPDQRATPNKNWVISWRDAFRTSSGATNPNSKLHNAAHTSLIVIRWPSYFYALRRVLCPNLLVAGVANYFIWLGLTTRTISCG